MNKIDNISMSSGIWNNNKIVFGFFNTDLFHIRDMNDDLDKYVLYNIKGKDYTHILDLDDNLRLKIVGVDDI